MRMSVFVTVALAFFNPALASDTTRDTARAAARQADSVERIERLQRDRARDADRDRRNAARDARSNRRFDDRR